MRRRDDIAEAARSERSAPRQSLGVESSAQEQLSGDGQREHVDERDPVWKRTLSLLFTIAVVAITIYLWPAMLGGSTRLVVVSGHSMEPTYDLLDIVVTRDAGNTQVGDIVVFQVPEGEAKGMLIIHRVLEVNQDGLFITQGDNRDTPDQWGLTEENIVGKPLAHLPKAGKLLGLIQNIWVIALLVGLVVLFVLWPDDDEEDAELNDELDDQHRAESAPVAVRRSRAMDETDALERDAAWALVDTPATVEMASTAAESWRVTTAWPDQDVSAEVWLDAELGASIDGSSIDDSAIDDAAMADAVAWLDLQLSGLEQTVAH